MKATFVLPRAGEEVRLHEQQLPLILSDTFTAAPGFSAPVHEADFAARKRTCDVLLVGSAHAPGGRPVERLGVELRVGPMSKRCDVVGDRVWFASMGGIRPSPPAQFVTQLLSYDVAFGGVDQESDDAAEHDAYLPNPVGRGFRKHLKNAWVDGRPLPNTEYPGERVTWPTDRYRPMAFGPVGRAWEPRRRFAGTYDQGWVDHVFPFLPADFDERYYQASPLDQQVPLPNGPMAATLAHFTPDGTRHFMLPHYDAPVQVYTRKGGREDLSAALDTIVFEPDAERFTMCWRATRPLRNSIFEISQVVAGRKSVQPWEPAAGPVFTMPLRRDERALEQN
jgi:hypothetical protein